MTVSPTYVEECLSRLEAADVVGYDVETSGLDYHKNFICGYVFTFGPEEEDTYYLPVRHKGGFNIPGGRTPEHSTDWSPGDDHPLEKRLRKIFRSKKRTWYAHNAKYDLHMSARHDLWIYGEIEDTQVAAALLNENQGRFDLDMCCSETGVTPKVSTIYKAIADHQLAVNGRRLPAEQRQTMGYFWEMPANGVTVEYARGDGISMCQLRNKQLEKIEEEDLTTVWDVERRVTRTLFRMERRGVPVSLPVLEEVRKQIAVELAKAKKKLPDGFKARSGPQVQKLFESMGYGMDQFAKTAGGKPSFTEAWLETQPMGKEILAVRKLENLDSTFIKSAILSNITPEGLVHCSFNQVKMDEFGTVSGRLSSSDPNFQQVPKRDKILAPLLRQIFRADPKFWWWSADYSQQEYRVFADYAQAKFVLEAYAKDPKADYHQLVADMLGVERDPAAKRINLGVIYNMGAPKLALSLGISVTDARRLLFKMQRLMPEAKSFNKTCENVAKSRGFVRTALRRRRRFPGGLHAHKAGNAVIQGTSADITKVKMAEIDELLMGDPCEFNPANSVHQSKLILQVHDSLDFLFVEEERAVMEQCMKIMTSFGPDDLIQLSVPMAVDINQGPSWGHATFPKNDNWVQMRAA